MRPACMSAPHNPQAGEKEGPKMIDEYCKDLCAEVRTGRIDPVIGREREVARVCQILARRTKNNPILVGGGGAHAMGGPGGATLESSMQPV